MVQFNNVAMFDPAQEAEIKRRRRMAEALQAQGAPKPTEVIGGYAVPQSGLQGLSQGLSAALGAYAGGTADEKEQELVKNRQELMAKAIEQLGTDPKAAAGILMQDPSMMAQGLSLYGNAVDNETKLAAEQTKFDRESAQKDREFEKKAALAREIAGMKNGMMLDPDTNELVPNPNSSSSKPLPVGALKLQDDLTAEIGGFKNVASDATNWAKKIRSGEVPLAPSGKIEAFVRNRIGASDEASRNVGGFNTFLEKMRNDLLMLAKGVQTEGDANRALKAIAAAGNDPALMADAMEQAAKVQLRGAELSSDRLNKVLKNYGQPALTPETPQQPNAPEGARQAPDGNYYIPDPNRPGKYLKVK